MRDQNIKELLQKDTFIPAAPRDEWEQIQFAKRPKVWWSSLFMASGMVTYVLVILMRSAPQAQDDWSNFYLDESYFSEVEVDYP